MALVLTLPIFWFWLTTPPISEFKKQIFHYFPIPLASVNGRFITVDNFLKREEIAVNAGFKIIGGQNYQIKKDLLARMVKESKLAQISRKYGVSVSKNQLEREYAERLRQSNLEGVEGLENKLAALNISKQSYQKIFLEPELLQINLLVWFNGQQRLNKNEFNLANDLYQKLNNGSRFDELAKNYSRDISGKTTNGDLGFVSVSSLIEEIREPVDGLKSGEIKIVPSRYGLHIFKLQEKEPSEAVGLNKVHLQQIFIKLNNFDAWYNDETKNYKIRQIIKF